MQRFESQESLPSLRKTVNEQVIEIHGSPILRDRFARRLQPWNLLLGFVIQFVIMRMTLRDEAPVWVYAPMLSMWLFAFLTLRFDLGSRLPGAKARAAVRARHANQHRLRLEPGQLLQGVGEKSLWSVAWRDVARIEARSGWNPRVVLHLRSGKRRVIYSTFFSETPEALAREFDAFRQRYEG